MRTAPEGYEPLLVISDHNSRPAWNVVQRKVLLPKKESYFSFRAKPCISWLPLLYCKGRERLVSDKTERSLFFCRPFGQVSRNGDTYQQEEKTHGSTTHTATLPGNCPGPYHQQRPSHHRRDPRLCRSHSWSYRKWYVTGGNLPGI